MSDETQAQPPVDPTPPVDVSALLSAAFQGSQFSDAMKAQFTEVFSASMKQQIEFAREQAKLEAQRQIAEYQAQQAIASFAQHVTTATLNRPHALPLEADRVAKFMSGLQPAQRQEAQALFEQILTAGLVSFEEYGSEHGEEEKDAIQAYNDALAEELKHNPRSVAIANLMRTQPALVAAYNEARNAKKGGR